MQLKWFCAPSARNWRHGWHDFTEWAVRLRVAHFAFRLSPSGRWNLLSRSPERTVQGAHRVSTASCIRGARVSRREMPLRQCPVNCPWRSAPLLRRTDHGALCRPLSLKSLIAFSTFWARRRRTFSCGKIGHSHSLSQIFFW